jgi:hypothetical protein
LSEKFRGAAEKIPRRSGKNSEAQRKKFRGAAEKIPRRSGKNSEAQRKKSDRHQPLFFWLYRELCGKSIDPLFPKDPLVETLLIAYLHPYSLIISSEKIRAIYVGYQGD